MSCIIKYKNFSINEDSFLSYLNKIIAVNNLFKENPQFSSEIYEALGFEIPTTKLQGKQFEYGEPRFFDVVEELTSGERASLPSSILINKLLKGEYLPEIKESQIILGLSEAGIWRPNIKKIEASGENKSTLAKKIGHELLHSVTSNIILSYQNLKGTVDFTDKYYKDFIRQGYIKPVDLSKSQIEALDNLVRIRNKVISYVEQNKDKIQKQDRGFGTYDYFIRTNYTESETDLHEFISEVFTNPELINILKEIPTEGKKSKLFKDFVDAIAKILGFTNTSILEDIIAYSEEAFFTQPQISSQQKATAQQLYSQYLDSLNKPNTNPILQGNQQEQIKKFAELQERLSNKEFLEGAKNAFESSEELQQFGTQEQYNDYIARVSLGIIKNPSSGEYNYYSKVKDIVYRGGNLGTKQPQDVEAFTTNKSYAKYRAEQNNTQVYPAILNIQESKLLDKKEIRTLSLDRDEFEYQDYGFTDNKDQTKQLGNFYTIKENNRHILGSKQDIEGFKKFVEQPIIEEIKEIKPEGLPSIDRTNKTCK